jgi:hypothetical protein
MLHILGCCGGSWPTTSCACWYAASYWASESCVARHGWTSSMTACQPAATSWDGASGCLGLGANQFANRHLSVPDGSRRSRYHEAELHFSRILQRVSRSEEATRKQLSSQSVAWREIRQIIECTVSGPATCVGVCVCVCTCALVMHRGHTATDGESESEGRLSSSGWPGAADMEAILGGRRRWVLDTKVPVAVQGLRIL